MFDSIAPVYDFLNRLLSLGIDRSWRKKLLELMVDLPQNAAMLDVATGTGDLALRSAKMFPNRSITGLDLSGGMLDVAQRRALQAGLSDRIQFILGDSEKLPFEDGKFQCTTVAFGVRNFENLDQGLLEMNRVLSVGGRIGVLEFSKPKGFPFRQIFQFYFRYILPIVGRLISKDPGAYRYLYDSVQQFPDYERFLGKLQQAGFRNTRFIVLSQGICCIYTGEKV